jgi:hypothetical protein
LYQITKHSCNRTIYEPFQPSPSINFPETGVTSILVIMADGKASEVGLVGHEGMLGLPVFLGAETSPDFLLTKERDERAAKRFLTKPSARGARTWRWRWIALTDDQYNRQRVVK